MAYKVTQTGDRVQYVLDDVEQKIDVATRVKNGYLSSTDKAKIDDLLELEPFDNTEIQNIWDLVTT